MNPGAKAGIDPELTYPDSDGKPMADNTEQFNWIVLIKEGLEALFANREDVFVAGDLLWYPPEYTGRGGVAPVAPDAMVVFGRPKGRRGSYIQVREEGIAPQVVFQVLSPSNTRQEMQRKLEFYEAHGVAEYYVWDPDEGQLAGWQREEGRMVFLLRARGQMSPRLGVRFEVRDGRLELYGPDGERFLSYVELKQRAERERQRAEQAERQREEERQRAQRLAARLRELGIDPDAMS